MGFTIIILLGLLVAFLGAWLTFKSDKRKAVAAPALTAGLRGILIFLVWLLTFAPQFTRKIYETQKPALVLLQDNSESVERALGADLPRYKKEIDALRESLEAKYRVSTHDLDGPCAADSMFRFGKPMSDLATPLQNVAGHFENLAAVVLLSDGNYNEGGNPEYVQMPINTAVYALALGDTQKVADLSVADIFANKTVALNNFWNVSANLSAKRFAGGAVSVDLTDASGNVLQSKMVNLSAGNASAEISFSLKAEKSGMQQFSVRARPFAGERNARNNAAMAYVQVIDEKKKVLLLYAAPHPDIKAIAAALKDRAQFTLTVRSAKEVSGNFDEFDCVILHQLPDNANSVSLDALRGKNIWLIAGAQTNYFNANRLQDAAEFAQGAAPHDVYVSVQNTFGLFNLPAGIRAATENWPPLLMQQSGVSARGQSEVLFTDKQNNPMWLLRPGRPSVAVCAGEGIWRWRMQSYKATGKQDVFDECVLQTVHFLAHDAGARPFSVNTQKQAYNAGEPIRFAGTYFNAANELTNTGNATLTVTDKTGKARKFNFGKTANAYALNIGALPEGSYTFDATLTQSDKIYKDAGTFEVSKNDRELMTENADFDVLQNTAKANAGKAFTRSDIKELQKELLRSDRVQRVITERKESAHLIEFKWLFALILLVATTEWLLRKYWSAT